jgi:hypothetical protein
MGKDEAAERSASVSIVRSHFIVARNETVRGVALN